MAKKQKSAHIKVMPGSGILAGNTHMQHVAPRQFRSAVAHAKAGEITKNFLHNHNQNTAAKSKKGGGCGCGK